MKQRDLLRRVASNRARLIPVSGNRKTGPIPISYTSARSCPDWCALKGAGCYAEGYPVAEHWGDAARFVDWANFCREVAKLPRGQLWRHNVAGDLPGDGDRLDVRRLAMLVKANQGKRGFTYTHKVRRLKYLRWANESGFTVNLSADNLTQADKYASEGLPTVVVLPTDAPQVSKTPHGRTVIACPAETRDITCARCQLCAVATRKSIVGFRAHGQNKRRVSLRVVQ